MQRGWHVVVDHQIRSICDLSQTRRRWLLLPEALVQALDDGGSELMGRLLVSGQRQPGCRDDVLSGRVRLAPLERLAKELLGEFHELRVVLHAAPQRCTGGETPQPAPLALQHPVLQSPKQVGHLGSLSTVVDVGLVQHEELPAPGVRTVEERSVVGTEEEVLQHGVVGEQQMRRPFLHDLPRDQLVRVQGGARVSLLKIALGPQLRLLGLTGVAAECDLGQRSEQASEALHLIVGQRIHRVEQ